MCPQMACDGANVVEPSLSLFRVMASLGLASYNGHFGSGWAFLRGRLF